MVVTSLTRRKHNVNSVLTSEQSFSENICWDRTFSPKDSITRCTLFFYSTSYRLGTYMMQGVLDTVKYNTWSYMIVHQQIFRLRCETTSMFISREVASTWQKRLLALRVNWNTPQAHWFPFVCPHEIACFSDTCG